MPKPPKEPRKEVYLGLRAAVITMRLFYKERWREIERKLGVKRSTAWTMWNKAIKEAGNEDFHDLLACTEVSHRPGRPPKVEDGSLESAAIRKALVDQSDKKWEDAAHDAGFPYARSTIENIAYDHRSYLHPKKLVRGAVQHKPQLDEENKEWRVEFAEWALQKVKEGAIFIFSDEFYSSFGGHPYKKQRITREEGQPAEELAQPTPRVQFSFMTWGAMCFDTEITPPMFIWDAETDQEREQSRRTLNMENQNMREKINEKRQRAEQPGTSEYEELRAINAEIEAHNERRKASDVPDRKGYRMRRKAEHIWKYDDLQRSTKLRGIDWWLYREKVLLPLLYPYYEAIQAKYPGREMFLVEDNARLHTKAAYVCERDREIRGIKKCPWPPNSPDLNPIELVWHYLRDVMDRYQVHGSSKEEMDKIKKLLKAEWSNAVRQGKMKQLSDFFEDKLRTCIRKQGDNN